MGQVSPVNVPNMNERGATRGEQAMKWRLVAVPLAVAVVLLGTSGGASAAPSTATLLPPSNAGSPRTIAGTAELYGMACDSSTTCYAVGLSGSLISGTEVGVVVPMTNGIPG